MKTRSPHELGWLKVNAEYVDGLVTAVSAEPISGPIFRMTAEFWTARDRRFCEGPDDLRPGSRISLALVPFAVIGLDRPAGTFEMVHMAAPAWRLVYAWHRLRARVATLAGDPR